jgi:acyl dehydratase
MAATTAHGIEGVQGLVGQHLGHSDWVEVTQQRVDLFAEATGDHQWIHVDPERARRESPFGGPIAHGFLTLSLLTPLSGSLTQDPKLLEGIVMGVNYGFEKVRFINPVKVNSRIRATSVVGAVEQKDANTLQVTRTVTVEIEGESKPALVADWITRLVYA